MSSRAVRESPRRHRQLIASPIIADDDRDSRANRGLFSDDARFGRRSRCGVRLARV
jgi:hypothetical protein